MESQMPTEIRVNAYAKVNFGLNVLPARDDGFHNIESIFQTVDLSDELDVRVSGDGRCRVGCSGLSLPEENTLTAAYRAFREIAGIPVPGFDVTLRKGIPAGGGLGGGSSDAAAFVRAAERLCGITLEKEQLDYIAANTGSDVFFFLNCCAGGRGCSAVSGRGEKVKDIPGRQDLFLVLIFPGINSSTREAYAAVDRAADAGEALLGPELEEMEIVYHKAAAEWNFVNTFTDVVSKLYPRIGDALIDLRKAGAVFVDMSGSGSTVYGVYDDMQLAVRGCEFLSGIWDCKLVRTV